LAENTSRRLLANSRSKIILGFSSIGIGRVSLAQLMVTVKAQS
jgi:hypothetical protein